MREWDAFPPADAESSKPALDPRSRDFAIRTVLGEAGQEPDEGQAGVAAVIRNRLDGGKYGASIGRVVTAPGQFEPWMTQNGRTRMLSYSPDSADYQRAASNVDRVFGEGYDPTNGATHFYSPTAQAALGRNAPSWAQGEGQPIGRHTFYAPEGRAQSASWDAFPAANDLAPQGAGAASAGSSPGSSPEVSTGGRFTDNAGDNFRVAREGQSPAADQSWPQPGSPVAEIGRKLSAAWESPTPKGLIGAVKPVVQGVQGLMAAGHGDVPMTDESGHTNPQVIRDAFEAAKVLPMGNAAGGIAGGVLKSARPPIPAALEANTAAQNIGVDLPRAIGSDSQLTRFMGQVANKMPGGGPMQEGVSNALKQTSEAVGRASEMAGGAADAMSAGQGFKSGIETSFKPTIKARIGEAYDQVGKLVDPNVSRPLEATRGAITDIMARRAASGEADPGKAVQTVLGGVQRPGGLTFEGVKDLRTRVGEMLDTGVFPEGMSQGELRRIYGALSDDLKATATAAGGDKALAAFNRANAMNKFAEDWKDNLGKVLGADRSGEGVTAALLRSASDGPTGDLKALTMARAAVPKDVWQNVASTAISQLGKDRKGEFSPNIFLNDFANLSDRGKTILFNDVGSGGVLPHLKDIATVSQKFVEAGKLANTSGTAGHNAVYTMGGAGVVGLLHGSLIEPVSAITLVVGNNLMARALSSPASAASVARWTRTYDALATNPAPRSLAAFNIASRNLASTMNSQFGSNVQPGEFLKAIQGPTGARPDQDQQN